MMSNRIWKQKAQTRKQHPFRRAVSVLSAVSMLLSSVGTATFATAEETVLICEKQEHLHTDDCYRLVLTCGEEERPDEEEVVRSLLSTFSPHKHT